MTTTVQPAGIHAIDATYGPPLTVYAVEGDHLNLIDTGVATTPDQHILPRLRELGASVRDVEWIITTHSHHDHIGGNAPLRSANPAVKLAVGARDVGWAESPRRYVTGLYMSSFASVWDPPPALHERVRLLFPDGAAVNLALHDRDSLDLGSGRHLRVSDVSAHSPGHVLLSDDDAGVLFAGDALQGRGNDIPGLGWLFPFYTDVDTYLGSLRTIQESGARWVCTAHFGVLKDEMLEEALADAERFVAELDELLRALLTREQTISLAQAVDAAIAKWPQYDRALQVFATCAAHLDRMVTAGFATASIVGDVKSWSSAGAS